MPDFYVLPYDAPAGAVERRVWTDPPSTERPSRIAPVNDQQHRFLRMADGSTLRLAAVLYGRVVPEADTVVGKFTAWCIEHPAPNPPQQDFPLVGFTSVVEFTFLGIGHYLFAMRHEDTQDAPDARAGGVVLVHVDVTAS